MNSSTLKSAFIGAAALSLLLVCSTVTVAADLMIYPTRVILTDKQRTAQVDLINSTQSKVSYKISLVRKRMTETGNIEDVTTPDPAEKFADDLVKFSPRQVTLLPGAGQTVRMMLKIPTELPEGEYRSHLVFTKVVSGISDLSEQQDADTTAVGMKITVNVGISIPVIARHGTLEAKAAIDPKSIELTVLQPKQQQLGFTLSRNGSRSVYGDVAVYRGQDKIAVGSGLAVYIPNSQRKIMLHVLEPYQLKSGEKIRLLFTEKEEKQPLAETSATIP